MTATQTTLTEGTHLFGSPEFDLLRRLLGVREEHCSFPNGSAYTLVRPHVGPPVDLDGYRGVTSYRYGGGYRMAVVAPDGAEYDAAFAVTRRGPGTDLGAHYYSRSDRWDGAAFTLTPKPAGAS